MILRPSNMRYTTIIDISEYPTLYRSDSIRILYLHLVLRSGYHDDDRDLIDASIRRLARDTGLTIGAVRHALAQLCKAGLITREGPLYKVRKYVLDRPITPRARSRKQEQHAAAAAALEEERAQMDRERRAAERRAAALRKQGKTTYMVYYEEQQRRAAAGDLDAIRYVRDNRKTYEQHAAQVAADNAN